MCKKSYLSLISILFFALSINSGIKHLTRTPLKPTKIKQGYAIDYSLLNSEMKNIKGLIDLSKGHLIIKFDYPSQAWPVYFWNDYNFYFEYPLKFLITLKDKYDQPTAQFKTIEYYWPDEVIEGVMKHPELNPSSGASIDKYDGMILKQKGNSLIYQLNEQTVNITSKFTISFNTNKALKKSNFRRPPYLRPSTTYIGNEIKLTQLYQKYNTKDHMTIGEKACRAGEYYDAIKALETAPEDSTKKNILLLWAYIESGNVNKAINIDSSININDAFANILKGRLQFVLGNNNKSLSYYKESLYNQNSMFESTAIRGDAIYYTALVHDRNYINNPSNDMRLNALTAWYNVKNIYSSKPNHSRFKQANNKIRQYSPY